MSEEGITFNQADVGIKREATRRSAFNTLSGLWKTATEERNREGFGLSPDYNRAKYNQHCRSGITVL